MGVDIPNLLFGELPIGVRFVFEQIYEAGELRLIASTVELFKVFDGRLAFGLH